MFCGNCGAPNGNESIFCEKCGIRLSAPVQQPASAPVNFAPSAPVSEQPPVVYETAPAAVFAPDQSISMSEQPAPIAEQTFAEPVQPEPFCQPVPAPVSVQPAQQFNSEFVSPPQPETQKPAIYQGQPEQFGQPQQPYSGFTQPAQNTVQSPIYQGQYGRQPAQQNYYQQSQPQQSPPPRKKAPLIAIIGSVTVVAIIAVVAGLFLFLSSAANPAKTAKGFVKSITAGNYSAVYDYLDIDTKDNPFLTKEIFEKGMKLQNGDRDSKDYNEEEMPVFKNFAVETVKTSKPKTKKFNVSFMVYYGENETEMTITVTLTQKGKKFFIFNDYKVTSAKYEGSEADFLNTISDVTVTVPKGCKVTIFGIELNSANCSVNDEDDTTVYTLTKIFPLQLEFVVSGEYIEDYEITKIFYDNEQNISFTYSNFKFKESFKKDLENTMSGFTTALYNAALEQASTSEAKKYLANNTSYYNSIESRAESIKAMISQNYVKTVVYEITQTDDPKYSNGTVTVIFRGKTNYIFSNSSEPYSEQNNYSVSFIFENNKWVISNINNY